MNTSPDDRPSPAELLRRLNDLPVGQELRNTSRRRTVEYDRMAASSDPLIREIGEQLRDGTMRPIDIARSSHYRGVLDRGMRELQDTDPEQFRQALEAEVEKAEERERDERERERR
jgi:hypothetical protein